jgi:hypothetical protein
MAPQGSSSVQNTGNQDDDVVMGDTPPTNLKLQETLKVANPDKFHRDRRELETFLLQFGIYFRFNPDKFDTLDAKSIYTASYLRGKALKWIEPFLSDYFENSTQPENQITTTIKIFGS